MNRSPLFEIVVRIVWIVTVWFVLTVEVSGSDKRDRASWAVANGGFFKNRKLKRQLDLIFSEDKEVFNSSDIEDAALILISYLENEGYLAARAVATIANVDDSESTVEWDSDFDVFLPRDTAAKHVRFELIHGPRFYYDALQIERSSLLERDGVERFF